MLANFGEPLRTHLERFTNEKGRLLNFSKRPWN
jgi:hypothetical protein